MNRIWISDLCIESRSVSGVYRRPEGIRTFVDVKDVAELRVHSAKEGVVVGAGVTLREWRQILLSLAQRSDLPYAAPFAEHLDLVAHPAVRNVRILKSIITPLNVLFRNKYFRRVK